MSIESLIKVIFSYIFVFFSIDLDVKIKYTRRRLNNKKYLIMAKKETRANPFLDLENQVLKFWEDNNIFQKSVAKEAPQGDYVFYDGPPFATGTPHYGHIAASVMKDAVPRYWTMKGYRVERRWGWDCHGLPIENIVEQEIGTKSKKDIEKYGVDKFNESCRSRVLEFADEWERVIRKIGRWAEMKSAYRTMDLDYMESIWWVFKQLWDKDLIYEGYRSMHVCPRCETTLSQSEVTEGYKDVKDLSVTAKFRVKDQDNTYILGWTTTPWTLIGNVALAVGEDVDYVKIKQTDSFYIIAKERLEEVIKDQEYEIVEALKGKNLIGLAYEPLFNYYSTQNELENKENGWKVYAGDFVNTEEGTGIVHIAPGFGEDDLNLGKVNNLPFIQHVDLSGHFKEEVTDFSGLSVKPKDDVMSTDVEIIKYLAAKELLFSKAKYEHSYPHCWRCDTPLLNYATSSWFVSVEKIKKDLLKQAEKINWSPEHIKRGRFGKWLEGARDWSISRQRFWASVIPIWKCDKCGDLKVIGSVQELEDASGIRVNDLHKHVVDKVTFACDKCDGTMTRIEDVLDCWFESGSMPYAQEHYPFENKEKLDKNFPAQFIAEGADQTRAWFYYLHVISTGIMNGPAYKNVIVNGIVLAEDGKKMSKKLKNYPDPMEVIEGSSADALRYYILTSPVMQAETMNFVEVGVKEALRKVSMLLSNVLKFYQLYEKDNLEEIESNNILDKWIKARLQETALEMSSNMETYNLPKATKPIAAFIDDLSTWYLRRSRNRLKDQDSNSQLEALSTLKWSLRNLALLMAPFTPFIAESLWQEINGFNFSDNDKSVHLENWPELGKIDVKVLGEMKGLKEIVELGLAKRDELGIKIRQPLAKIMISSDKVMKFNDGELELLKSELNVKAVKVKKISEGLNVELDIKLDDDLIKEGIKRELVRMTNNLRKESGLTITDRVILFVQSKDKLVTAAVIDYAGELKAEVLADDVQVQVAGDYQKEIKINQAEVNLGLKKNN